jgi:hypothetical protein
MPLEKQEKRGSSSLIELPQKGCGTTLRKKEG